ncbi:hypothetical protein AcV5_000019 [Taiwanofungus camphoratus]|nr:hypothetical protein AcV5_000019 [Antrodia cinnamomea]
MKWGALSEVTNIPSVPKESKQPTEHLLKVKGDESQKWWSIGCGRKDSKEKSKEKTCEKSQPQIRSQTPEPAKSLETRARFNSLDSGIMLSNLTPKEVLQDTTSSVRTTPQPPSVILDASAGKPSDTTNDLLAPAAVPANGSIAVRAIKSMRSLARMASWAQLTNTNNGEKEGGGSANANTNTINSTKVKAKEKEKDKGDGEKKKKKEKEKEKEKEKTIRYSGSSFEAGALSTQGSPAPLPAISREEPTKALGKKKQSVLGLGLPSTMRLMTVRNTSSSSHSSADPPPAPSRLSVDSAHLIMNAQGRPTSVASNSSSLRPPSTASAVSVFSGRSARSSSSSVVSVRWDEAGIRSSKEMQRKERKSREKESQTTRGVKESRRSSESRKRKTIMEIFPKAELQRPPSMSPPSVAEQPIVTVEEATVDGHSDHTEERRIETPVKRARPRPVSEQMLGRARPQAICDDGDGVLSILDAATNDLASLINRLDLEATPASSTKTSPVKPVWPQNNDESPIKKRIFGTGSPLKTELRESNASISSLRPYGKLFTAGATGMQQPSCPKQVIGQQIAPWSELNWEVSPRKAPTRTTVTTRLTHKRTLTPVPAAEPPLVFQPLRPAKAKSPPIVAMAPSPSPSTVTPPVSNPEGAAPSSATFGSRPSKVGLRSSNGEDESVPSPTPVFKRSTGDVGRGSSLVAIKGKINQRSLRKSLDNSGIPISPEARKGLGLTGTMGGSPSTEPPVDPEDSDSDIPDELQVILSGQSDEECTKCLDDTLSFRGLSAPSSPVESPELPLPQTELPGDTANVPPVPLFQLHDEEANQADIDEGGNGSSSEDDTKKSFDFTGELQKLNESGASDRRSFVEQLENAFRTPARIELGYGLGEQLGLKEKFLAVPPVPALPPAFRRAPPEDVAPQSDPDPEGRSALYDDLMSPPCLDSGVSKDFRFFMDEGTEDECRVYPASTRSGSMRSKASDGQLNVDFKFGGKPSVPETVEERQAKPMTLSDIIPPLSHIRSPSQPSDVEEDSSVLRSIMAKASEIAPAVPRPRLHSDSSSKRRAREVRQVPQTSESHSSHSRNASEASFTGFESFDEVRRGFEFGPNRPAFYPSPGAFSRPTYGREDSVFSIASESSYGAVVHSGSADPFGYGPSRPPSIDAMLMSMSVDDTFSFIHRDYRRQRVDSDASSFYFRAPGSTQVSYPSRRGHRRHESGMSIASNGPPISLYNRSFGAHRRNDSGTSVSSVAHSYAMYGAHGGRAAWARHRHDASIDSQWSDFSAHQLGRPGLGDKMFDNDHGMPLTAISASPPESVAGESLNHRPSWESFSDEARKSFMDGSLFEKTTNRTSVFSDSVFGCDQSYSQHGHQLPTHQFRPLSMMSEASVHSPRKEDDTMITMLDGDRVRRRSISWLIGTSPCVRVEKMQRSALPQAVLQFRQEDVQKVDSPNKTRLIEKPSIASTSSRQFGGERMIMARKGLLERQSLEDSAFMAHGEDLLVSLCSRSIFSRPEPGSRSRSSTVSSSGAETPPLSSSDGSSQSSGSQSSIDLGYLNALLTNSTYPSSGVASARARARARGTGHRHRISQARASRSSVYEIIQEESSVASSPSPIKPLGPETASPLVCDSVFIVDGDTESMPSDWDEEHGITTLQRYYALRDEAQETVVESKQTWVDTPFSIFAVQSFHPPRNRGGMRAMLEHSQKNYRPLPSDLHPRRVRSRTSSRASPYPIRIISEHLAISSQAVLQKVPVNGNVKTVSPPAALEVIKPFTPFTIDFEPSKLGKNLGQPPLPTHPRATSSARCTTHGRSKRSTGKFNSNDQKENVSQGTPFIPSETLRLNRLLTGRLESYENQGLVIRRKCWWQIVYALYIFTLA